MYPINKNDARCSGVRKLLSEYIDNTLSAHRAWEVEKHLTACASCAEEVRLMQATVHLLNSAPRFDTSDSFMASLHARLDTVDPSGRIDRAPWLRIREWFSSANSALYRNRVPALSVGLAATAIALVVSFRHPDEPQATLPVPAVTSDSVHVSVASSASSPFSDPAADNLEYRLGTRSSSATGTF